MMPEMDGVQVLEHIIRDPVLSGIPAIMISALDEIDGVARCIEKGAVDYFAKPFDPVLLRARVSATLQSHRLRQDLRRAEDELAQSRTSMDELVRSVVPRPLADGFERGERSAQRLAHALLVQQRLVGVGGEGEAGGHANPERLQRLDHLAERRVLAADQRHVVDRERLEGSDESHGVS